MKRREGKSKGEKERCTHLNAEFQRIATRDKKAFLSNQCKEMEETKEWERLEISSKKLEIPREHFMQRWTRNGMDLTEAMVWTQQKQKILRRDGKNTQRTVQKISS